jgi:hypothetical protein
MGNGILLANKKNKKNKKNLRQKNRVFNLPEGFWSFLIKIE